MDGDEEQNISWAFNIVGLSKFLSLIPILNIHFIMVYLYGEISTFFAVKFVNWKLNKLARKHGYSSFKEWSEDEKKEEEE
jgi:hypothetical protein